VQPPSSPWLVVQGDSDDVVPLASVQEWMSRFAPTAELVVLPGVGHYFHGRLPDLRSTVLRFLEDQKKSPAG
jgi:uncharacterized protein